MRQCEQLFSSTVYKGHWGSFLFLIDIPHLECLIHLEGICVCFHASTLSGVVWLFSRSGWRSAHPVVVSPQPPAGHFGLPGSVSSTHWAQELEHPARKACQPLVCHLLTEFVLRGTQDTRQVCELYLYSTVCMTGGSRLAKSKTKTADLLAENLGRHN